jgi:hypothetical protein
MAAGNEFHLDHEQRRTLRDCLNGGVPLVDQLDRFVERIEASIDHYRRTLPEGTFREAYDSLRELNQLCQDDDPSPALLRARLSKLPPEALQNISLRAPRVIPALFGEPFGNDPFEPPADVAARFLAWAATVPRRKLVTTLRALSGDGGRWVKGRSRRGGKRSAPHFESRIMGLVRGSQEPKSSGGRPTEDSQHTLVMHLAVDWLQTTGRPPESGRSNRKAFGKLVHMVFEWIYVPERSSQAQIDVLIERAAETASYCLRRYWKKVEQVGLSPRISPSYLCVDCKWILPKGIFLGESHCNRLDIACSTAREAEQACGMEGKLFEPSG